MNRSSEGDPWPKKVSASGPGTSNQDRARRTSQQLELLGLSDRTTADQWWAAAGALLMLAISIFAIVRATANTVDDGFTDFVPDVSLFPPAPVEDASTLVGIGRPDSWPTLPGGLCAYSTWMPDGGPIGDDWHTVRHDWVEDDAPKSWIISEHTSAFTDLDDFDDYVRESHEAIEFCGWTYDDRGGGGDYNSILTELDGLPDGAFAFTIDASPDSGDSPTAFGNSNPDEFQALGAVLPGRERGQLMYVTWIGWGIEVPRDEFAATATTLYEAAHETGDSDTTPELSDASSEGTSRTDWLDFTFTEFDAEQAGVTTMLNGSVEFADFPLYSSYCERRSPLLKLDELSGDAFMSQQNVESESRTVTFVAGRWHDRSSYLEAKQAMATALALTCIESLQHPSLLIEPTVLPELPAGTITSIWRGPSDTLGTTGDRAAVVTNDDNLTMMIVGWNEKSEPVPSDEFVAVVNHAWTEFQADNP